MPQLGRRLRMGTLVAAALVLAGCGQSDRREAETAAAPVRQVVERLSNRPEWVTGKCLCVGMFREDAVEDFPAGLLQPEFARHAWLHNWSECEPHYSRPDRLNGCGGGMVDFVCSISERRDLPQGTTRVLCHVNGQSEALQKEGYLQDEYDVTLKDGRYVARPVSLKGTSKIHE